MRAIAALALAVLPLQAQAADIPLKAPRVQPVLDWTGLYFGAHAGFGRGFSNATLADPAVVATGNFFGGPFGGLQAGYNFQLPSKIVLGIEADVTFPNYIHGNSVISSLATAKSWVFDQMDFVGSVRGRLGYATGPWLFYATGGLAFAGERFLNMPSDGNDEKRLNMRLGWAAGAGAEVAFAPHWSFRLEYLYSQFENATVQFASGATAASTLNFQQIRVGLNRKIDWPAGADPLAALVRIRNPTAGKSTARAPICRKAIPAFAPLTPGRTA